MATRDLAAVTVDGVTIQLMANIDLPEEIEDTVAVGAAGIGLYRSEFLYIEKSPEMPTEEDHLGIYKRLAEAVAPHPLIIRTYDLGGRKLAKEMMDAGGENPVLGMRGLRLTMARPAMFRTQLRAVFRAARDHEIWLMLPLVASVEEVREFRSFADQVLDELEAEGRKCSRNYRLGVMIEVPSAAMVADHLAQEVDFFSIGTNDLIQYSQAVDRNNEQVAHLYRPLHPGLLRMLRFIIDSAREAGIEVSLCGEMAADPTIAPLLVGLGLRRMSVSPRLVPVIKAQLRRLSAKELADVAERCLEMSTADEVAEYLNDFLLRRAPEEPSSGEIVLEESQASPADGEASSIPAGHRNSQR
jgi:phosphotransferase system enzyme I (PtsI)